VALPKKRAASKSDAAKKFSEKLFAKAKVPIPTSEVRKAAAKEDINWNMLNEITRGYIDKKKGPGGIHYWYPPTSSAYVSDTPADARKNSAAFRAGYEEAVEEILWRVKSMCSAVSDKKSKDLCARLLTVLEELKNAS
jgi:hypothetical protein